MVYAMCSEQERFQPGQDRACGGLGRRGLAAFIDAFVVLLLSTGLIGLIGATVTPLVAGDIRGILLASALGFWFVFLIPPLLAMSYSIVMHACGGQTIGKMFLGLRVVATTGENLSMGAAFLRWTGLIVSTLPLGAGLFWAVVDKNHCAWHDYLSCSRVVAARNPLTSAEVFNNN